MPALVPNRFLFRITHPCLYRPNLLPLNTANDTRLLNLPEEARLYSFAELDGQMANADVRIAWNELGLAVQVSVTGKAKDPLGDAEKPRMADGVGLWLDTRGDRTAHRASRFCHQFFLLPCGGGSDKDEPAFVPVKIHRALQDAPLPSPGAVPFRCHRLKRGYLVEAFLPAAVLNGYDPEQHRQLGIYYHVRDSELGDQYLGVNTDFPFADDPSLWDALELVK